MYLCLLDPPIHNLFKTIRDALRRRALPFTDESTMADKQDIMPTKMELATKPKAKKAAPTKKTAKLK